MPLDSRGLNTDLIQFFMLAAKIVVATTWLSYELKMKERLKKSLHRVPIKYWRGIEVSVAVVMVVIVWGLFSLPIIFYHLPENEVGLAIYSWGGGEGANSWRRFVYIF